MYLLTVTLHTKLPTNDYLNNVPRHYVMLVTFFHPKNLLKLLVHCQKIVDYLACITLCIENVIPHSSNQSSWVTQWLKSWYQPINAVYW